MVSGWFQESQTSRGKSEAVSSESVRSNPQSQEQGKVAGGWGAEENVRSQRR